MNLIKKIITSTIVSVVLLSSIICFPISAVNLTNKYAPKDSYRQFYSFYGNSVIVSVELTEIRKGDGSSSNYKKIKMQATATNPSNWYVNQLGGFSSLDSSTYVNHTAELNTYFEFVRGYTSTNGTYTLKAMGNNSNLDAYFDCTVDYD